MKQKLLILICLTNKNGYDYLVKPLYSFNSFIVIEYTAHHCFFLAFSNILCIKMRGYSLPSLRPPGVRALLSPGQVFLLAVIDTSSSTLSARAPSMPLGRRSTRTRWLSVPPEIFSILYKNLWCGGKSLASWTWTWVYSLWSDHLYPHLHMNKRYVFRILDIRAI